MNNIVKKLGINVKELRKKKRLSQGVLAEKIGISIRQLSRIETGASFISTETIYNICVALNVQPSDLFDFKLDENIASKTFK